MIHAFNEKYLFYKGVLQFMIIWVIRQILEWIFFSRNSFFLRNQFIAFFSKACIAPSKNQVPLSKQSKNIKLRLQFV